MSYLQEIVGIYFLLARPVDWKCRWKDGKSSWRTEAVQARRRVTVMHASSTELGVRYNQPISRAVALAQSLYLVTSIQRNPSTDRQQIITVLQVYDASIYGRDTIIQPLI